MHWLILISEIKERNPPSVYRLCCCQRSIFSFSFPCPALRMFALRSFHTYLRSILLAPGHLPSAVQFCFATSVTWYSYGINRRASKKAHVVAFCIQGWIPALWLVFLTCIWCFNLQMPDCNSPTLHQEMTKVLMMGWRKQPRTLEPVFMVHPIGKVSKPEWF